MATTATALALRTVLPAELMLGPFQPQLGAVLLSAWYGGLSCGTMAALFGAMLPWLNGATPPSTENFALYGLTSMSLVIVTSWLTQRTQVVVQQRTAALLDANALLRQQNAERERAEKALAEERNFVAALFDTVGSIVAVLDHEGRVVRINRAGERLGGYSANEVQGRYFFDLIEDPAERQAGVDFFRKVLAGPIPAEYETVWRTRGGSRRRIHWSMTRLASEFGEYIVGSGSDVTERRHMEEAVRQSEARFASMFANAPTGMALLEPDGTTVQLNEAFANIVGYPREQLLTMTIADIMGPTEVERSSADRQRLLNGEVSLYRAERCLRHKDGSPVWVDVSVSALRDASGRVSNLIAQHTDITLRKRAEAELLESEAKFRALAETVAASIFIYRGDRILYVNGRSEELCGYTRSEFLAMEPWAIIHPDWRHLVRDRGQTRQRGEAATARHVLQIVRKDGNSRWIDYTTACIEYDGAQAILGTAFDITAWKSAEELLREREAELAHVQRLDMLGQMAAGLAHEINQPLAAIVNYARGCTRRIDGGRAVPEEMQQAVEQIAAEAMRAAEVVRRLRRHLRKELPSREEVDLNTIVQGAAQFVAREAEDSSVRLRLALTEAPIPVVVDRVQIEQVLLNVLRNALESLGTCTADHRAIEVRTLIGHRAEVVIEDNGAGLTTEAAGHMFDPFFTTKASGLGVGLSISRSIIEAHGGSMQAEPVRDSGVCVRVRLPLQEESRSYVH